MIKSFLAISFTSVVLYLSGVIYSSLSKQSRIKAAKVVGTVALCLLVSIFFLSSIVFFF